MQIENSINGQNHSRNTFWGRPYVRDPHNISWFTDLIQPVFPPALGQITFLWSCNEAIGLWLKSSLVWKIQPNSGTALNTVRCLHYDRYWGTETDWKCTRYIYLQSLAYSRAALRSVLVVAFYHINLAKMELHFPKYPSPYDSMWGLVKRDICVRSERQK